MEYYKFSQKRSICIRKGPKKTEFVLCKTWVVSKEQRTVSSALSAMSFSDKDWQSVDPRQTLILAGGSGGDGGLGGTGQKDKG